MGLKWGLKVANYKNTSGGNYWVGIKNCINFWEV
jgi:hypothetical protein